MKKLIVSLSLACFMVALTAGCGGDAQKKPKTSGDNPVHTPSHKTKNMKVKAPPKPKKKADDKTKKK